MIGYRSRPTGRRWAKKNKSNCLPNAVGKWFGIHVSHSPCYFNTNYIARFGISRLYMHVGCGCICLPGSCNTRIGTISSNPLSSTQTMCVYVCSSKAIWVWWLRDSTFDISIQIRWTWIKISTSYTSSVSVHFDRSLIRRLCFPLIFSVEQFSLSLPK